MDDTLFKADSPLNFCNKDSKICSRFICVYNLACLARSMIADYYKSISCVKSNTNQKQFQLFARYARMKRKAKRLIKRQTDYRRLRSAREQSVQSFSNISRSKIPRMRHQRPLSEPNQPRPFSAAVLASEHAGAMPRSKWRLENPPAVSDESSENLGRDPSSPDSQFPRSISFPTSSARGLDILLFIIPIGLYSPPPHLLQKKHLSLFSK